MSLEYKSSYVACNVSMFEIVIFVSRMTVTFTGLSCLLLKYGRGKPNIFKSDYDSLG